MAVNWRFKTSWIDWFEGTDITEEEAVARARQIMADAGYGNEAIECIIGWDECVYTLLHDPDAAKRYLKNSAGNDYTAALNLKMYLTD